MATTIRGIFTAEQAGEYLDLGADVVRLYCREGRINAEKVGRDWIIRRKALDEFRRKPRLVGNPNFFKKS